MQSFVPPSPTIQAFFTKHGQELHYGKKQTFARADDPQPWVYFLSEGIVEVAFTFDEGDTKIIGFLVPNSVFSQNRLFFGGEGDLDFTTLEQTTFLRVHRDVFLGQLDTNPDFTREYLQTSLIFRIFVTDMLIYLGENRVRNRCVRWLILMAKYYGEPTAAGQRIGVQLTHKVIANFLHISRESVSKTLREFIRNGCITIDKKYITIKDPANLKDFLE